MAEKLELFLLLDLDSYHFLEWDPQKDVIYFDPMTKKLELFFIIKSTFLSFFGVG